MQIEYTRQFKKDYKREQKGKYKADLDSDLAVVVELLLKKEPLDQKFHDHALIGNWKDFRDCHLKPDLILIYRYHESSLQLVRLGSHSKIGL
jgi:mRNA interferase YafQ